MILVLAVWGATALGQTPCTEVAEDLPAQKALAPQYLKRAEEERAAGRLDAAEVAYREALRRDASLSQALVALRQLCEDFPKYMLEGVQRYDDHDDEAADAQFLKASQDPILKDAVDVYRAAILRRGGRADFPLAWFEAGPLFAGDHLRRPVHALSKELGRRNGFSLAGALVTGADTLPAVLPDDTPASPAAVDGLAAPSLSLTAFPLGEELPGAQVYVGLQKQFRAPASDLLETGLALAWQSNFDGWIPRVELLEELQLLGFRPYLWNQQLRLAVRRLAGKGWFEGSYVLGYENYRTGTVRPYSGFHQAAALSGTYPLFGPLRLQLGYFGSILRAQGAAWSHREHGPKVGLRWFFGTAVFVDTEVAVTWRTYNGRVVVEDPFRSDLNLDGGIRAEWMLAPAWSLLASAAVQRTSSSAPTAEKTRVLATVGVSYILPGF